MLSRRPWWGDRSVDSDSPTTWRPALSFAQSAPLDVSRCSRAGLIDPTSLAKGVQLGGQKHSALRVACDDPPLNILGIMIYAKLTQDCPHCERHGSCWLRRLLTAGSLLAGADHVRTSS
jgi:hypothetical protein